MKKKTHEIILISPIIITLIYEIYVMIKIYLDPPFFPFFVPTVFLITLTTLILFYLMKKNDEFKSIFYAFYLMKIPYMLLFLIGFYNIVTKKYA